MSTEERLREVEASLAGLRETVAMLRTRDEEALRVQKDIFSRLLPELSERIGRLESMLQQEAQKTAKLLGGVVVVAGIAPFVAKLFGG
tara:strand:- start:8521 stop:8784 length:264 start_codon:yes stop_codon:yes gene_type:complete